MRSRSLITTLILAGVAACGGDGGSSGCVTAPCTNGGGGPPATGFQSKTLSDGGTTYGYQLITRIAGSLCRLIDDKEKRLTASMVLIDAHIDGVKAAIRDDIKTEDHPVGKMLVTELERRVTEFGA